MIGRLRTSGPSFAAVCLVIIVCVCVGGFSSCSGGGQHDQAATQRVPGLVDRLLSTGVINAGYGVYPPYTEEDPNTKKVSGFSIE